MGQALVRFEVDFADCCCSQCGISYYVPQNWQRRRRDEHDTFYCPNGHGQHYPHETDAEKYKRKSEMLADQVRMEREQRERAEKSLRVQKAQTTKLKKRVAAGVCPCCHRSFTALSRHMKTKHPDYLEGE